MAIIFEELAVLYK